MKHLSQAYLGKSLGLRDKLVGVLGEVLLGLQQGVGHDDDSERASGYLLIELVVDRICKFESHSNTARESSICVERRMEMKGVDADEAWEVAVPPLSCKLQHVTASTT